MVKSSTIARFFLWSILLMLYAPLIIIVLFSFTESKVIGNWTGFSVQLYGNLFSGATSVKLIRALVNTLLIALISGMLSTLLGSVAAVGIFNLRNRTRKIIQSVSRIPILNADIITGVSLLLLFVSLGISRGFVTVVLAHVTFCTPYVVLSVMPRLHRMDPNLYEAALDLGATPSMALRKVILPEILPGIISGFILSVTLSIDDFVVTIFNIGNEGLETLSTYIYNDARKGGLTPELRALSTIIFIMVLTLLIIINRRAQKKQPARNLK